MKRAKHAKARVRFHPSRDTTESWPPSRVPVTKSVTALPGNARKVNAQAVEDIPVHYFRFNVVEPASLLSIWTTKAGVRVSRIRPSRLIHTTTSHGVYEALFGHSPFCFDYSVATPTPRYKRDGLSPSRRRVARLVRRHLWD